jgi:hypothetical protein
MSRVCLSIDNKRRLRKAAPAGGLERLRRRPKEVEMNVVTRGWGLGVRRAVAVLLGLVAAALLDGYLIRA